MITKNKLLYWKGKANDRLKNLEASSKYENNRFNQAEYDRSHSK